ncbi:hypothetical protein JTB14_033998 [Gonioctena quinquepunctata]|nr:hypothetical protein JTB14_033998 [Gonioctena quinquepunctata]
MYCFVHQTNISYTKKKGVDREDRESNSRKHHKKQKNKSIGGLHEEIQQSSPLPKNEKSEVSNGARMVNMVFGKKDDMKMPTETEPSS